MDLNVLDTECYTEKGKFIPYLFVYKNNENNYNFFYIDLNDKDKIFIELLYYVVNNSKILYNDCIYLYTHNINFDGYIFVDFLTRIGIPFEWFMRDNNLYWLEFKFTNIKIRIRCSYKMLGKSVHDLGNILKYEKMSFPYSFMSDKTVFYVGETPDEKYFNNLEDYLNFKNKWGENINIKDISIYYCLRDVEIVWKSLKIFIDICDKKLFQNSYSFSSYSYRLFSKKFDKYEITKKNPIFELRKIIENSYFGGRTEIFGNTKKGIIHRYDFPGMYSSCMLEKFPYGEPFFSENLNNLELPGIYTISVESDLDIPLLPVRIQNKESIYPNGRFTTCISKEEAINFVENGGKIIKIINGLVYKKEDYIFKDFVEHFEEIKKKEGFYKIYGKQIINSLYGSFALRNDNKTYCIVHTEEELELLKKDNLIKSIINFKKYYIVCINNRKGVYDRDLKRDLIYASLISSKARVKLHKNLIYMNDIYKKRYGEEYKLLYLETDSIDVSIPENKLGEKLMDIKWQKIYTEGVYISPKFYYLKEENKPKIKGINNNNYNFDEISKNFYDNKKNLVFESQKQFFNVDFVKHYKEYDKNLRLDHYNKRIFSNDKLSTKPHIFNEF